MNINKIIIASVLSSLVSSCQTIGNPGAIFKKSSIISEKMLLQNESGKDPRKNGVKTKTQKKKKNTGDPVNRIFQPDIKNQRTAKNSKLDDELDTGKLSLELDQVRLEQALKIILGDLLKLNYVLAPNITGQVTLRTSTPITRKQMFSMLEVLLRLHGLSSTQKHGIIRISAASTIKENHPHLFNAPNQLGYGVEIVPLQYVSSIRMQKLLTPLLTKDSAVPVDGLENLIFLRGSSEERETARKAITILDVDQMARQHVAIFGLKHTKPDPIIAELKQVFRSNGSSVIQLNPIKRLNALLVIAPNGNYIERVQTWIKRLDKTIDADQRRLFVYFVKYGDANNLVKTLKGAFSKSNRLIYSFEKTSEDKSVSSSKLNESIVSNHPSFNSDSTSNSILVWATGQEYELISEVLAKLDIMPLQVLIEGTVLEVTLQNNLRYGLKYLIEAGEFQSLFTGAGATNVAPLLPGFGATIGGPNNTKVVIDALSELTDVRVVSSPQLLVMDGRTARLHVGDQVPIVRRSSSTTSTDDDRITNEVEYRNTGVTLDVTPNIKASGLVTLKISQEVSDVVRTNSSDIDSPTIQQRQIVSTASLPSGTSVLLAGLIREVDTSAKSGLPGLHNIPGFGFLFGSRGNNSQRTELVVLITPKILKNSNEVESTTRKVIKKYQSLVNSSSTEIVQ